MVAIRMILSKLELSQIEWMIVIHVQGDLKTGLRDFFQNRVSHNWGLPKVF